MATQATKQQMAEAVAAIRANMADAARAAGRDPAEVLLCAACKTRTVEEVRESAALDIDLFGENHVQELVEKTDAGAYLGKPGHFIGHLQTNKVNKVVGRAAMIESVDSQRLLDKIETAAARLGVTQDILIEINIGDEESKSGVSPDALWALADAAEAAAHLRLRGLMAIPPADAAPDETRAFFAQMRTLLTRLQERHYAAALPDTLSMGMSGDYQAAIREGATIVRIGTAIYGARDYGARGCPPPPFVCPGGAGAPGRANPTRPDQENPPRRAAAAPGGAVLCAYSILMPVPSKRRTTSGKLNLAPFSVLSAGAMT